MNIDPKTEQDLTELAAQEKQYWQQRKADIEALATIQGGNSISHDEMKDHFQHLRDMAQERL